MTGYHDVEHVMGMAVSIDVRDDGDDASDPGSLAEVVTWLHHVDQTFSTYIDDSPISRLGRGEIGLDAASDEVRDILLLCEQLRADTDGAFDAFAVPAPNGTTLDPSGVVKGWSIERAAELLERRGHANFTINAGGDIAVRGHPAPAVPWRVGIRHPDEADRMAAVLEVAGSFGVATSATYERGAHIVDPHTGQPTTELASVTIIGPDLTFADAYATAVFVMGIPGLDWLTGHVGYEGYAITHYATTISTPGFSRWRVKTETVPG